MPVTEVGHVLGTCGRGGRWESEVFVGSKRVSTASSWPSEEVLIAFRGVTT